MNNEYTDQDNSLSSLKGPTDRAIKIRTVAMEFAFQAALQYGAFQKTSLPIVSANREDGRPIEHNWAHPFPDIIAVADTIYSYILKGTSPLTIEGDNEDSGG